MRLWRISLADGMCSPTGINPIFSGRFLSDLLAAVNVERAVFIVLACHLMNPFDLGLVQ